MVIIIWTKYLGRLASKYILFNYIKDTNYLTFFIPLSSSFFINMLV